MGTIANAKVTHYYNCYNGDFIGCLLFFNFCHFFFNFCHFFFNFCPQKLFVCLFLISVDGFLFH